MRANLLFEWQVGLIPHYASLPVKLVTDLGARILDFREVEQIESLARTNRVPGTGPAILRAQSQARPPSEGASASVAGTPRTNAGASPSLNSNTLVKIDVLRAICRQYGLASLFGLNDAAMHQLVAGVNDFGRPILAHLTRAGISPPKTVVMCACITRRVGLGRFEKLMNSSHTTTFLHDLATQAGHHDVNSMESATSIQQATNRILDQLLKDYLKSPKDL